MHKRGIQDLRIARERVVPIAWKMLGLRSVFFSSVALSLAKCTVEPSSMEDQL